MGEVLVAPHDCDGRGSRTQELQNAFELSYEVCVSHVYSTLGVDLDVGTALIKGWLWRQASNSSR